MIKIVNFEGVKAIVRKANFTILGAAFLAVSVFILSGCPEGPKTTEPGKVDPNEAAATVNGKIIKLEEVERLLKQQAQGQEANLSPLELAQARLQILQIARIQADVHPPVLERGGAGSCAHLGQLGFGGHRGQPPLFEGGQQLRFFGVELRHLCLWR